MEKRSRFQKAILKEDIRYRGPLSYTAFKLLGWLCIAAAATVMVMNVAIRVNEHAAQLLEMPRNILVTLKNLSLPFFLLGNYAVIIDNKNGYRNQLLRNGMAMLGVIVIFYLIFYRYLVGIHAVVFKDAHEGLKNATQLVNSFSPYGYLDVNIFVDLFLCTLFMFFLNARPKKFFSGKKQRLFRSFALLPVLYETASLTLKGLQGAGLIELPEFVSPMLTVKPPMTFIVFIVLAMFIKNRERRFCAHGYTHEEYEKFLKTRRNSWHFSVFTALILFAAGITDSLLYALIVRIDVGTESSVAMNVARTIGLGNASALTLLSPIILLFSYTRRNKNRQTDMIIPFIGMGLVALVLLEGSYELVKLWIR